MKKRIDASGEPARKLNRPFANLAERLGFTPQPQPPPPAGETGAAGGPGMERGDGGTSVTDATPVRSLPLPRRAVVRIERKGRGGRTATVVEHLELDAGALERWVEELRRALGCGGIVEGDAIVLQGDLRPRVKALLEARGVRRVTLG